MVLNNEVVPRMLLVEVMRLGLVGFSKGCHARWQGLDMNYLHLITVLHLFLLIFCDKLSYVTFLV